MRMTLMGGGQQVVSHSCEVWLCVRVRRTVIGSSSCVKRLHERGFHGIFIGLLPGAYHGRRLEELLAVALSALVAL